MKTVKLLKSFGQTHSAVGIMLHVILLESALELIPREITQLKEIQRNASRRGKKPGELLLDQTHHGRSMTQLERHERRGRPDIVYLSLMSLLETPLCRQNTLSVYVHMQDGRIIELASEVRLPRNYNRFIGLFEQLLLVGSVPPDGTPLLRIMDYDLAQLITRIGSQSPRVTTALMVEGGHPTSFLDLQSFFLERRETPMIVGVGAFPHGDFSKRVSELFETQLRLDSDVMMAWHVCTEVVWAYHGALERAQHIH
ncbi:16S rRNA methyltransferase [Candidatus Thorarchaeota archaeon]|nr:MAG: 16S rRNA methyltransferase [Candidatus Thorarchaeota archaeon]